MDAKRKPLNVVSLLTHLLSDLSPSASSAARRPASVALRPPPSPLNPVSCPQWPCVPLPLP